ncbi:MAG TPA: archaeal heat shock protein Hsp20 [Nitrososphaeraceae archaeon]|nr:archaeal heat shock protein Hsp20 [Nitrososphaeraceae archaeon]
MYITECKVKSNMWSDPWKFSRGILEDIDKEFAEAENMLNRMFRTVREMEPSAVANFPYYYGYQITVGPDGKPKVREFGNVRPAARGLVEQSGIREPLVDTAINEKENALIITAEMPGVTKQDIKVNVADEFVSIHAEQGEKKYHTDIPVNVQLDDSSAKATYSNGILELKIKLKQAPKLKGKEVKVE